MRQLKAISLFCGCGGTDLGLIGGFDYLGHHYAKHNVKIVFANDFEPSACALFEENFGIKPDSRDIRQIISSDIPDADLILGGFPCQSFSVVAQNPPRLGVKSDKGKLFLRCAELSAKNSRKSLSRRTSRASCPPTKGRRYP